MLRRSAVIASALAGVLGLSGAAPVARGKRDPCRQSSYPTLLDNREVEVHNAGGSLIVCSRKTGHREAFADDDRGDYWACPPAMALVGSLLAYAEEDTFDGNPSLLRARDVPSFLEKRVVSVTPSIGAVALRADGVMAFIGCVRGQTRKTFGLCAAHRGFYKVKLSDGDFRPPSPAPPASKSVTVARGGDIDPYYLKIRGARLYWRQHGHIRSIAISAPAKP